MRRALDVVLVAAVIGIAAVAAVDALDGAPRDRVAEARQALREAGAAGRLVVSGPDCARREVILPDLRERRLGVTSCAVYGRPGALGLFGGAVVWYGFPGGITTLLPAGSLDPAPGVRAQVMQVAWLGNVRYAVTYRSVVRPGEWLAVLERHRRVGVLGRAGAYFDIRSSPRARLLAARSTRGVEVWNARGEAVPLPREANRAKALAWSPDERFTLAATEDGVLVFRTGARDVLARIPIVARDLDWSRP